MSSSSQQRSPNISEPPLCRLAILGRFELSGGDGLIDVPGKKLKALLAYLALTAPMPQRREHLTALHWGNNFDTQARASLRQALSRLRKVLPAGVIIGDDDAVTIDLERLETDAVHFESLMSSGRQVDIDNALRLVRGPILDGLDTGDHEFDAWIQAQRKRYAALQAAGYVRLAEADREAGAVASSLERARKAIDLAPLREDAHRLAMMAHLAKGQRHEGLLQFAELKRLLETELDTQPEPATVAIAEALRSPGKDSGSTIENFLSATHRVAVDPVDSLRAQHQVATALGPGDSAPAGASTLPFLQVRWFAPLLLFAAIVGFVVWKTSTSQSVATTSVDRAGGIPAADLAGLVEHVVLEGLGSRSLEPYLVSFAPNGVADAANYRVLAPGQLGRTWTDRGKWWIEGNVLHLQFPRWAQGRLIKRVMGRKGDEFYTMQPREIGIVERAFFRSNSQHWGGLAVRAGGPPAISWGHPSAEVASQHMTATCTGAENCDVVLVEPMHCVAHAVGAGTGGPVKFTVKTRFAEYSKLVAAEKCSQATGNVPCRIVAFVCADGRHRFAGPT